MERYQIWISIDALNKLEPLAESNGLTLDGYIESVLWEHLKQANTAENIEIINGNVVDCSATESAKAYTLGCSSR